MNITLLLQHLYIPSTQDKHQQAQRLFHGRGHAYQGLHHLSIDWLPPVLLITLFAKESETDIQQLTNKLLERIPDCKSVQLQRRYLTSGPIDVVYGKDIQQFTILENGLRYQINLGKNRNTGLFLDMKNGRQWVQQHSNNKRVLNLFAYTCGFSVAAIAGGAKSVYNIDMSRTALNVGRENHRLNHHSLDQVSFDKLNIFKSFGRIKKRGPYDLLICDPPTFQKGSVNIEKDYPKIIRRLDQFMAPHSSVLLCLNAPELDKDFLFTNMKELAPNYSCVEEIDAPAVYVDAENKGLKILHFVTSTIK